MSGTLDYSAEKAKLAASYWNGLAIAAMALGALPFVVGVSSNDMAIPAGVDGSKLFIQASAAFFAAMLSRFFHVLALRAVSKACDGYGRG